VLIDSYIKACAEASAAAAEKLRNDLGQKAKLATAKAALEDADAEVPQSQTGTAATALRTAKSAGRTPESASPTLLKPKQKTKRKNAILPAVVDFEVTVRAYLHAKTGSEPATQRPRLAK